MRNGVVLVGVIAFAQPFTSIKAQTVRLSNEEGYVVAELVKHDRERKVKQDRWYHWVRTQQLFITQGGSSGSLLEGPYSAYYATGELKEQGRFRAGLKHGEWKAWGRSGGLRSVEHWCKGRLDGVVERFDEVGTSTSRMEYRHGKARVPSERRRLRLPKLFHFKREKSEEAQPAPSTDRTAPKRVKATKERAEPEAKTKEKKAPRVRTKEQRP